MRYWTHTHARTTRRSLAQALRLRTHTSSDRRRKRKIPRGPLESTAKRTAKIIDPVVRVPPAHVPKVVERSMRLHQEGWGRGEGGERDGRGRGRGSMTYSKEYIREDLVEVIAEHVRRMDDAEVGDAWLGWRWCASLGVSEAHHDEVDASTNGYISFNITFTPHPFPLPSLFSLSIFSPYSPSPLFVLNIPLVLTQR